jgi:phosphate transport system substrate-binding protein
MKLFAKAVLIILLFTMAAANGVLAEPNRPLPGATPIRISGSQSMLSLTERLTQWYQGRNAGIAFEVQGGNPAQGFSELVESRAQIVQSTRKALDGEVAALRSRRRLEFVEVPVATEFAVIAVNTANPVKVISLFDLRMILSGQIKNWKQVGGKDLPIRIYGRDENSGVRSMIDEDFMGDASFISSIKSLPTNTAVLAAVASDPAAIAFCDVDLHAQKEVRLVGIKASASSEAVEPTGENIRTHRYTLSRTLYFYFAGQPTPELTRFAAWVLSPEGQLVVEAVGLYPLGQADREEARQHLTARSFSASTGRP